MNKKGISPAKAWGIIGVLVLIGFYSIAILDPENIGIVASVKRVTIFMIPILMGVLLTVASSIGKWYR